MQDCADWSKPATRVVIDCGGTVARSPYRSFLACGAAVLLAGLVYLNSLHNPFVYDDSRSILDNRPQREVELVPALKDADADSGSHAGGGGFLSRVIGRVRRRN